uniref:Uncharacterized protein n=1 Tax=Tanacetum cinerariifolium TaxID=118510 RepID=A0A6L2MRK4_TANCI|nr:hypothetical protein [Tanacetum cinerariifolium]
MLNHQKAQSQRNQSHLGTESQHKSSGKSTQAEEPKFKPADIELHQDQGIEPGHIDDQPDNEATPNHDCVLHYIASNLDMDYLPKRHGSNLEMKRSRIMVKEIDKLLFEKRLMRNLEKFVGGRDYGNDLRLLDRTI